MTGIVRIVTLWIPDWPVVAAGRSDQVAMVLRANRVVARSRGAAARGVQRGHRKRMAQQRCPDVVTLDHDPDRDARAFEPVVRAVAELTPRVEVIEPGWLCFDARGPSRYYGGDEAFAARLHTAAAAGLARAGIVIGIGIADGRFASSIASRRSAADPAAAMVIQPGESPTWLAPQPIGWLSAVEAAVSCELVELFGRLGLTRLGDLATLDARDVLGRFGPVGQHAHRLAGGRDARPADQRDPPPHHRVEHPFDEPAISLDHVVFVAKHLADELVGRLAADAQVIIRLVVIAETEHGERSERAWYRAAGMTAPAVVERVRWQLDGWIADQHVTAGVVHVALVAEEVRAGDGEQLGLWGGRSGADEQAIRAVARLSGMVGNDHVVVPAWQGGRQPGTRYRWVPAVSTDLGNVDDTTERLRPASSTNGRWPGVVPPPSPAVVPADPVPVDVCDAADNPVVVSGRGELSGAPASLRIEQQPRNRVVSWAGPWPLDEWWWDPARHRRVARFQLVTEHAAAHLVFVEGGRWWLGATYG